MAASRLMKEYKEVIKNQQKRSGSAGGSASLPLNKPKLAKAWSVSGPPITDFDSDESEIILFPPDESKMFHWTAYITGPPDSPFEGGRFQLKFQIPNTYPHAPPKVHFVTRCCHPNVHWPKGDICLDILKDAWTPIWTLESTCRAIIFLLSNPAADSPLNCDAGNLIRCGDLRGYWSIARSCTLEYAHFIPKHRPPKLSVVALTAPPAAAGATGAAAASVSAAGLPPPPAFVTSPSQDAAAGTGTAPSATGSSASNSFVYLSFPPPAAAAATATAPAKGAAAAAAPSAEAQTKTAN